MPDRIGLLGGTFDPVHNGHLSIAESFVASGFIDQLWILLTPDPPHKTNQERTSFELRLAMLTLAFQGKDKVKVLTIENELPRPSYTYRTISYLKRLYPEKKYLLCFGGDSLQNFHSWKEYQTILAEVDLLVADRPGEDLSRIEPQILQKVTLVNHEVIEDSSTKVKKLISKGETVSHLVPSTVEKLIVEKGLYKT